MTSQIWFTSAQKTGLWERWKQDQRLKAESQLFRLILISRRLKWALGLFAIGRFGEKID